MDAMSADQIVEKGKEIQKKDLDALDRMINTTEQSKQVGMATTAKLAENTEKLRKTDQNLDELESNIKQVKRYFRSLF